MNVLRFQRALGTIMQIKCTGAQPASVDVVGKSVNIWTGHQHRKPLINWMFALLDESHMPCLFLFLNLWLTVPLLFFAGYCLGGDSLDVVCAQIRVEAILYTLVRGKCREKIAQTRFAAFWAPQRPVLFNKDPVYKVMQSSQIGH